MIRTFTFLVALCSVATAATAARPGYLSAGFPPPLRFRDPQSSNKTALGPLPKAEPTANFPIPTNALNQCVSETVISSSPEQSVPATMVEPAAPPVTPQMLIQYFQDGNANRPACVTSNHTSNVSAIVPVGFVPPAPGPAPSSTATYISR